MKQKKAVITGDITGFTQIAPAEREALVKSTKKVFRRWMPKEGLAEFFRGDSFQLLFEDVREALHRSIQLRSWLKQSYSISQKPLLDARIAIGIGEISYFGESVLEADGEAFHLSGRTFDKMEAQYRIVTGDEKIDRQLEIIADLMNLIIKDWTKGQAEVIFLLLEGLTQQEMADKLKVAQSAVNNRIKLSQWKEIEKSINYISDLIDDLH